MNSTETRPDVLTYEVKPDGKKFVTICRSDGYWVTSWVSKNKRQAKQKGKDYVDGKRSPFRGYRTQHGEMMDAVRAWERRQEFLASLKENKQ